MAQWELRIEGDGFLSVFFGDGTEIETQQHAGAKEVSCSGVRGHAKHFGKRSPRFGIPLGLDVSHPKDVSRIYIRAWKPGLHLFEIGNGLARLARKIKR